MRGGANALVTIVEFSDYQCPYCKRVEVTLKELQAKYGEKVRIVWKDKMCIRDSFRPSPRAVLLDEVPGADEVHPFDLTSGMHDRSRVIRAGEWVEKWLTP